MSTDPGGQGPLDAWKHNGVRVVPADRLDPNTAQTPGMQRQAAIDARARLAGRVLTEVGRFARHKQSSGLFLPGLSLG